MDDGTGPGCGGGGHAARIGWKVQEPGVWVDHKGRTWDLDDLDEGWLGKLADAGTEHWLSGRLAERLGVDELDVGVFKQPVRDQLVADAPQGGDEAAGGAPQVRVYGHGVGPGGQVRSGH